jgi:hypothetical protein
MTDALPRWERFEHDADVVVRGWGHTRAEAFEEAAVAMTQRSPIRPSCSRLRASSGAARTMTKRCC